jgi:uncharacterized phosphosugar-binding protein
MGTQKGYEQFFDEIGLLLDKIRKTQGPNIEKAADLISDAVSKDGLIHVFGTGHSNVLAEDLAFRTGTLVPVNHIIDLSLSGSVSVVKSTYMERLEGTGSILFDNARSGPNDIFIVISNSGRNAAPVEMARDAKRTGHKVITVTSVEYSKSQPSRHSSGKLVLDFADVVIDNCGAPGDVSVFIPGLKPGLGPTSTIAGSYILNAVMLQAVFNLKALGIDPPVFVNGNLEDGMDFNQVYLDQYWNRMKNW